MKKRNKISKIEIASNDTKITDEQWEKMCHERGYEVIKIGEYRPTTLSSANDLFNSIVEDENGNCRLKARLDGALNMDITHQILEYAKDNWSVEE